MIIKKVGLVAILIGFISANEVVVVLVFVIFEIEFETLYDEVIYCLWSCSFWVWYWIIERFLFDKLFIPYSS